MTHPVRKTGQDAKYSLRKSFTKLLMPDNQA
jgi:hypothetical protein